MRRKSAHVIRDEQGQSLLMFVLFIIVLIVFVGLGVDLGFAYITRATLSKGVDSACLTGMRNLSNGQTITANAAALAAFSANYGTSGRDVAPPVVTVTFKTVNNNNVIDVAATVSIKTYFIRVLPQWATLAVGSVAEATRADVIMTLVLDRSGSMLGNGGSAALPPAVTSFIGNFDDVNDIAAMVSFANAASVDVPMQHPFKTQIENAANALVFNNSTCSDEGLTNALAQNNTVAISPGQDVIKVIVFFTDGMANTFNYYNLNCGPRNMAYNGPVLYDPVTGNGASAGCTVPNPITSIDGVTQVDTANDGQPGCISMHLEAEQRAETWANAARSQTNFIYCIGLGNPSGTAECNGAFPILNPVFLKNIANTTDSATYNPNQPVGDFAIAADSKQLQEAFNTIASKILLRLSK